MGGIVFLKWEKVKSPFVVTLYLSYWFISPGAVSRMSFAKKP